MEAEPTMTRKPIKTIEDLEKVSKILMAGFEKLPYDSEDDAAEDR